MLNGRVEKNLKHTGQGRGCGPTANSGWRERCSPRRDIDVILYDALRCTLQSCLDLYGIWRSSGESLDGGGEDGSKPPTGCVLAQSPCQVNPGSVRDKEELKQRSVGDEGTLCQLER
ncbi:hypothetical protein FOC1_g10015706 [Fusarium oxysporum f. sp. cubense race 1]|uniref:Uncharacterized protein n=1 Tax=Fusarium oxysporum f. sp. cubense (strain race 1) TaxID=1229664 RepID=N4TWD8_FUSC1|nr:hypothetical protein FOC1_g10015706 [Fusarium oxysporum f. sp. cubense race 1]